VLLRLRTIGDADSTRRETPTGKQPMDTHYRRAEAAGVTDKQLATVSVWRDVELFDEREQAALRLAEITTELPDHDTAEREYARAAKVLSDDELSAVIWIAVAINSFNRVSILSRHRVKP
jgi:alkylhydroperoxidase family enzyme